MTHISSARSQTRLVDDCVRTDTYRKVQGFPDSSGSVDDKPALSWAAVLAPSSLGVLLLDPKGPWTLGCSDAFDKHPF